MTRGHLTLSGPNDLRETREVYRDNAHIGRVIPVTHVDCIAWEARDLGGNCHGDRWLKDWYAAEALERGLFGASELKTAR
jgi:hypothetical protein